MTQQNKNRLWVTLSVVVSFVVGCIVGKHSKGQSVFLRLIVGSILLALAVGPNTFGWYGSIYCLRCVLGIMGACVIGKMSSHDIHSVGMLLLGIIVYFISMAPNSFDMSSYYTTIDQHILQITFRLIGSFMIFVGIHNPDK